MHPLLNISDLFIDFKTESGIVSAVRDISFQINRGEIVAVVGESGSGKSVTALSILQLLPTSATYEKGSIMFSDDGIKQTDLLNAGEKIMRTVRGNLISMIFQEPMTSLNPVFTCGQQVAEVLQLHKGFSFQQAKQATIAWFEKVKLPDPVSMFDRYPHQLSGGQKQRVMIAMALCCEPSLLICDEPTTALDVTVQKTILQLIRDLQTERKFGVLFITHDIGVVAELADRVVIMYQGKIMEEGTVARVLAQPRDQYTKSLLACRPSLHKKGERLPVIADFLGSNETKVTGNDQSKTEIPTIKANKDNDIVMQVRDLSVWYPAKKRFFGKPMSYIKAVDDVSFEIRKGETLGIVGESGSGKTTLGRALLRLVEPTKGSVWLNDTDLTKLSNDEVRSFRKNIQIIFQDPYSSLNPRMTIGSAIGEAMEVHEITDKKNVRRSIEELLKKVNLPSDHVQRYPHEFSGGQRQRIVIARALALDPTFLVCDESVSALDVSVQAQVLNLLNDIKKELGLTIVFISHDLSVVRYMCDRILVMKNGRIVESGNAENIYEHPQHVYTRTLIDSIPKLPPSLRSS